MLPPPPPAAPSSSPATPAICGGCGRHCCCAEPVLVAAATAGVGAAAAATCRGSDHRTAGWLWPSDSWIHGECQAVSSTPVFSACAVVFGMCCHLKCYRTCYLQHKSQVPDVMPVTTYFTSASSSMLFPGFVLHTSFLIVCVHDVLTLSLTLRRA